MGRKIIIQPHSDDALFSCYDVIRKGGDVQVLTIEKDERRIAEDENLYNALGIKHNHLNVEFKDESYYEFFRENGKRVNRVMNSENAFECLMEYYGEDKLSEIADAIEAFVLENDNKRTEFFVPAGIGHPFHLFVSTVVFLSVSKGMITYYREFPHSFKKRSGEQMEEFKSNHELIKSVVLSEEDAERKWELARKYYKSQSGLLFFEQGYIKKNLPEEYYRK